MGQPCGALQQGLLSVSSDIARGGLLGGQSPMLHISGSLAGRMKHPAGVDESVGEYPGTRFMAAMVMVLLCALGASLAGDLVALPLSSLVRAVASVLAAFVLWRERERCRAALWFGIALLCYAGGASLHGASLLMDQAALFLWSGLFYLAFRILSLAGIMALGRKGHTPWTVTLWIFPLLASMGVLGWTLLHPVPIAWLFIAYLFCDVCILVAAAPYLAAALQGEVPSSRFFWILGWSLFWMGALFRLLALLDAGVFSHGPIPVPTDTILVLSLFCVCLGYVGEARGWELGLWPFILGTGLALMVWAVGLLFYRMQPLFFLAAWLVVGGLIFLGSTLGFLMGYLATRRRAIWRMRQQNAALERSRSSKSAFLASMSHELLAPLHAIATGAASLEEGRAGNLDVEQRDLAAEIHQGGARLLALVERILELAGLEAGRVAVQHETIDLAGLLEAAAASFRPRCAARHITLEVLAPADGLVLNTDATQLRRILDELLENALASFQDGSTTPRRICLQAGHGVGRKGMGDAEIICADTGQGMDNKPAEGSYAAFQSGLRPGIGLALAKERLALLGGSMRLESVPGQGTAVHLHLAGQPGTAGRPALAAQDAPVVLEGQEDDLRPPPPWLIPMALGGLLAPLVLFMQGGVAGSRLVNTLYVGLAALMAWRCGGAWRFLGLGLGLNGLTQLWSAVALFLELPALYQWRWPLFHAAYPLIWLGLMGMTPRCRPRKVVAPFLGLIILAALPIMAFMAQGPWLSTYVSYPLLVGMSCLAMLPALEAALDGRAPPGRLLWAFGFLVLLYLQEFVLLLALSGMPDPYSNPVFVYLYFVIYLCWALGLWAEQQRLELCYAPILLGCGSFLLVWAGGLYLFREQETIYDNLVVSGAVILFLSALAVLASQHARIHNAHRAMGVVHRALEQAEAARRRFLDSMSHHLRTPLNAILGFADLLKLGDPEPLPAAALEQVRAIESAGEHVLSLLHDILDITAIETGDRHRTTGAVAMDRLITNSLAIVKERSRARRIALVHRIDPDVGACWTDARSVKQLLFNCLALAVRCAPEAGEVTLCAELVPGQAMLAWRPAPGFSLPAGNALDSRQSLHVAIAGIGSGLGNGGYDGFLEAAGRDILAGEMGGVSPELDVIRQVAGELGGAVAMENGPGRGGVLHVWLPWENVQQQPGFA